MNTKPDPNDPASKDCPTCHWDTERTQGGPMCGHPTLEPKDTYLAGPGPCAGWKLAQPTKTEEGTL